MRRFFALSGTCLALAAGLAQAQQEVTIWSCRDKEGRTTVTNQKEDTVGKNCRIVQQSRVQVVPAVTPNAKPGARAPTSFPKEDASARAAAKERQREILERELSQEQKLLEQAQKDLAAQEAVRYGNEQNYARVLERLQPYKENVERHQKNVESLQRELANLYR